MGVCFAWNFMSVSCGLPIQYRCTGNQINLTHLIHPNYWTCHRISLTHLHPKWQRIRKEEKKLLPSEFWGGNAQAWWPSGPLLEFPNTETNLIVNEDQIPVHQIWQTCGLQKQKKPIYLAIRCQSYQIIRTEVNDDHPEDRNLIVFEVKSFYSKKERPTLRNKHIRIASTVQKDNFDTTGTSGSAGSWAVSWLTTQRILGL